MLVKGATGVYPWIIYDTSYIHGGPSDIDFKFSAVVDNIITFDLQQ